MSLIEVYESPYTIKQDQRSVILAPPSCCCCCSCCSSIAIPEVLKIRKEYQLLRLSDHTSVAPSSYLTKSSSQTNVIYCPSCGHSMDLNLNPEFCGNCGLMLEEMKSVGSETPQQIEKVNEEPVAQPRHYQSVFEKHASIGVRELSRGFKRTLLIVYAIVLGIGFIARLTDSFELVFFLLIVGVGTYFVSLLGGLILVIVNIEDYINEGENLLIAFFKGIFSSVVPSLVYSVIWVIAAVIGFFILFAPVGGFDI